MNKDNNTVTFTYKIGWFLFACLFCAFLGVFSFYEAYSNTRALEIVFIRGLPTIMLSVRGHTIFLISLGIILLLAFLIIFIVCVMFYREKITVTSTHIEYPYFRLFSSGRFFLKKRIRLPLTHIKGMEIAKVQGTYTLIIEHSDYDGSIKKIRIPSPFLSKKKIFELCDILEERIAANINR